MKTLQKISLKIVSFFTFIVFTGLSSYSQSSADYEMKITNTTVNLAKEYAFGSNFSFVLSLKYPQSNFESTVQFPVGFDITNLVMDNLVDPNLSASLPVITKDLLNRTLNIKFSPAAAASSVISFSGVRLPIDGCALSTYTITGSLKFLTNQTKVAVPYSNLIVKASDGTTLRVEQASKNTCDIAYTYNKPIKLYAQISKLDGLDKRAYTNATFKLSLGSNTNLLKCVGVARATNHGQNNLLESFTINYENLSFTQTNNEITINLPNTFLESGVYSNSFVIYLEGNTSADISTTLNSTLTYTNSCPSTSFTNSASTAVYRTCRDNYVAGPSVNWMSFGSLCLDNNTCSSPSSAQAYFQIDNSYKRSTYTSTNQEYVQNFKYTIDVDPFVFVDFLYMDNANIGSIPFTVSYLVSGSTTVKLAQVNSAESYSFNNERPTQIIITYPQGFPDYTSQYGYLNYTLSRPTLASTPPSDGNYYFTGSLYNNSSTSLHTSSYFVRQNSNALACGGNYLNDYIFKADNTQLIYNEQLEYAKPYKLLYKFDNFSAQNTLEYDLIDDVLEFSNIVNNKPALKFYYGTISQESPFNPTNFKTEAELKQDPQFVNFVYSYNPTKKSITLTGLNLPAAQCSTAKKQLYVLADIALLSYANIGSSIISNEIVPTNYVYYGANFKVGETRTVKTSLTTTCSTGGLPKSSFTLKPSDNFNYQYRITNNGNVEVNNVFAINMLPIVGDKYILNTAQARNSSASLTYTGLNPNNVKVYIFDARNNTKTLVDNTNYTLSFSTLSNFCLNELGLPTYPSACVASNWTTTTTTSNLIAMKVAMNSTYKISPQQELVVEVPMTVPSTASLGTQYVNSFAANVTTTNGITFIPQENLTPNVISISNSTTCIPCNTSSVTTPEWQWPTGSNWFFGDGMVASFSNNVLTPIKYLDLAQGTKIGYEGNATVSDKNGNLLYFSNGRRIWKNDAANTLISSQLLSGNENGTSVGSSAVQGVLFVSHPANPDKVYVFTTDDANATTASGLNYSILTLSTGVVTAPIRLGNYRTTEQLDATFHANGQDIWISVRESGATMLNNFKNIWSYKLTETGLVTTPVQSIIGVTIDQPSFYAENDRGALKFSWDGKKAAMVNQITAGPDADDAILLFDFNNTTGVFSNTKSVAALKTQYYFASPMYPSAYDCEFTPDNSKLIVSFAQNNTELIRLNTTLPTATDIYNSIQVIANDAAPNCDIKLGPDGKIYQNAGGNNNFINIYAGDLNNATTLTRTQQILTRPSRNGFSNMFIPYSTTPVVTVSNDVTICAGSSTQLVASGAYTYSWSPATGLSATNIANPIASPTTTTTYTVTAINEIGCQIIKNVTVTVSPLIQHPVKLTIKNGTTLPDPVNGDEITVCTKDLPLIIAQYNAGGTLGGQLIVNGSAGVFDGTYMPGKYIFTHTQGACVQTFTVNIIDYLKPETTPYTFTTPPNAVFTSTSNSIDGSIVYPVSSYQIVARLIPEISVDGALQPNFASLIYTQQVTKSGNATFSFPLTAFTNLTIPTTPTTYFYQVGIKGADGLYTYSKLNKLTIDIDQYPIPSQYLTVDGGGALNKDINWVYSVTFLDDNKTDESIAYIDGLGHARQVQTKLSTSNQVMAVETAYSTEGGDDVSTLPAPTESNRFDYAVRFFDVKIAENKYEDYSTKHFDRLEKVGTKYVVKTPSKTDITSGVGKYYSPNNNLESFVDDAKGLPFAYDIATPDPSGRVYKSSAPGEDFSINSGKEMTYLYEKPTVSELTRVYGATRAQQLQKSVSKSIVIDPNGVGQVTYTDIEGKTIATAMTVVSCSTSTNPTLDTLTENGTATFVAKENFIGEDVVDKDNLQRRSSAKINALCAGETVQVNYKIDYSTFSVNNNISTPICQTCKYDLEIKIIEDATQEEIYSKVTELKPTSTPDCASSTPSTATLLNNEIITLPNSGGYTVYRTLKPFTDKTSGKNQIQEQVTNFENDLATSATNSKYYQEFLAEKYGKEEWFVLRKVQDQIAIEPEKDFQECKWIELVAGHPTDKQLIDGGKGVSRLIDRGGDYFSRIVDDKNILFTEDQNKYDKIRLFNTETNQVTTINPINGILPITDVYQDINSVSLYLSFLKDFDINNETKEIIFTDSWNLYYLKKLPAPINSYQIKWVYNPNNRLFKGGLLDYNDTYKVAYTFDRDYDSKILANELNADGKTFSTTEVKVYTDHTLSTILPIQKGSLLFDKFDNTIAYIVNTGTSGSDELSKYKIVDKYNFYFLENILNLENNDQVRQKDENTFVGINDYYFEYNTKTKLFKIFGNYYGDKNTQCLNNFRYYYVNSSGVEVMPNGNIYLLKENTIHRVYTTPCETACNATSTPPNVNVTYIPGIKREFYNIPDSEFTNGIPSSVTGGTEPVLTETSNSSTISFDFGLNTQPAGVNNEKFGLKQSGYFYIDQKKSYYFHAHIDDGYKLTIDGKTIINSWKLNNNEEYMGHLTLDAGYHYFETEFYEYTGAAFAKLEMHPEGDMGTMTEIQPFTLVPSTGTGLSNKFKYTNIDYLDQVNLDPVSSSTTNYKLSQLDGITNKTTQQRETDKLVSNLTLGTKESLNANNSPLFKQIKDIYQKANGGFAQINSIQTATVNLTAEGTEFNTLPLLNIDKTVASTNTSITLVKVNYATPGCGDLCPSDVPDWGKDCPGSCDSNKLALKAQYLDSYDEILKHGKTYTITNEEAGKPAYVGTLSQLITKYPPYLNNNVTDNLSEEDEVLYTQYQSSKLMYDQFDRQGCINACQGGAPSVPDLCLVLKTNYTKCFNENVTALNDAHDQFLTLWDAKGAFPYTALEAPATPVTGQRYLLDDVELYNSNYYNYLKNNFVDLKSKSDSYFKNAYVESATNKIASKNTPAFTFGGYTCASEKIVTADAILNSGAFPEYLTTVLQTSNQACIADFNSGYLQTTDPDVYDCYSKLESSINALPVSTSANVSFASQSAQSDLKNLALATLTTTNPIAALQQLQSHAVYNYLFNNKLETNANNINPLDEEKTSNYNFLQSFNLLITSYNCFGANKAAYEENTRKNLITEYLSAFYQGAELTTKVNDTYTKTLATATGTGTHPQKNIDQLRLYLMDLIEVLECQQTCKLDLTREYTKWLQSKKEEFVNALYDEYLNKCFPQTSAEVFTGQGNKRIYHYTLYNYDAADNLISTVPPAGIDYININSTDATELIRTPSHRMLTYYKTNSYGWLQNTSAPDMRKADANQDQTKYWYDKAGRIRFSQTAEQVNRTLTANYSTFSYTLYDEETGRILKTGELQNATSILAEADLNTLLTNNLENLHWPVNATGTHKDTASYHYDTRHPSLPAQYTTTYLQERVAYIQNANSRTHFSYDPHGRVNNVIQEIIVGKNSIELYNTVDITTDVTTTSTVNYFTAEAGSPLSLQNSVGGTVTTLANPLTTGVNTSTTCISQNRSYNRDYTTFASVNNHTVQQLPLDLSKTIKLDVQKKGYTPDMPIYLVLSANATLGDDYYTNKESGVYARYTANITTNDTWQTISFNNPELFPTRQISTSNSSTLTASDVKYAFITFDPGSNLPIWQSVPVIYLDNLRQDLTTTTQVVTHEKGTTLLANNYKQLSYNYSALTSRVNKVTYQAGTAEQFIHKYSYDADDRLIKAEISKDNTNYQTVAQYNYYLHGPLKNQTLGNNIQQLDYIYNLQGWLKAINGNAIAPVTGTPSSAGIAPDVFAQVLNYYEGDYKGTALQDVRFINNTAPNATVNKPLYNGMVTSTTTYTAFDQVADAINVNTPLMNRSYKYDQLYRLKATYTQTGNQGMLNQATWTAQTLTDIFNERLTYDANGNITSLERSAATPGATLRDKLTYYYNKNDLATKITDLPAGQSYTNNQLLNVTDEGDPAIGYKPASTTDKTNVGLSSDLTYAYDLQGRLIKDASKQIAQITWTAFNKVETITRAPGSTKPNLTFKYDGFGHRIYKRVDYGMVAQRGGGSTPSPNNYEEWYIQDASGNEITSYKKFETSFTSASQQQIIIFAASKVGYYKISEALPGPYQRVANLIDVTKIRFEITDYQGSIRAVVTGAKTVTGNADIVALTDYYAFGSVARKYVSETEALQFGFHGMKRDNQVDDDDDYTTEFRQYDSDLGRWLSVDPLMAMFADLSSYNFNYNNPINFTDVLGLGPDDIVMTDDAKGYEVKNEEFNPDDFGGGSGSDKTVKDASNNQAQKISPKRDFTFSNNQIQKLIKTSNEFANKHDNPDRCTNCCLDFFGEGLSTLYNQDKLNIPHGSGDNMESALNSIDPLFRKDKVDATYKKDGRPITYGPDNNPFNNVPYVNEVATSNIASKLKQMIEESGGEDGNYIFGVGPAAYYHSTFIVVKYRKTPMGSETSFTFVDSHGAQQNLNEDDIDGNVLETLNNAAAKYSNPEKYPNLKSNKKLDTSIHMLHQYQSTP